MKGNVIITLLFAVFLVSSCKDRAPGDVMSKGKMEDVLYEYHLARSIAMQKTDSVNYFEHVYTEAVFKKYHISKADFDSSMIWYSQHTDQLYSIYQNIDKRLDKDSRLLGVQTSQTATYSKLTNVGDTANVWNGRSFYCLTSKGFNNVLTFSIKADTSYYAHDRLMWHFKSHFIYQSGSRDAIVNLSVRYDNDSVGTITQHLFSDGDYNISLELSSRKIKQVYGFVFHNAPWSEDEKILIIMQPSLVRFHQPKVNPVVEKKDSTVAGKSQNVPKKDSMNMNQAAPKVHNKPIPIMKLQQNSMPPNKAPR